MYDTLIKNKCISEIVRTYIVFGHEKSPLSGASFTFLALPF